MQSERFLSLFTKEKGEAGGVDSNISVSSKKNWMRGLSIALT